MGVGSGVVDTWAKLQSGYVTGVHVLCTSGVPASGFMRGKQVCFTLARFTIVTDIMIGCE